MTKEEFITAAEIAFEKLMTPTRGIPPARLEEPMSDGAWSFKDVAAHFVFWNTLLIRAVERLNQGTDFDLEEFDAADAQSALAVERMRAAPLKRVMTELRLTHSTLTEAVRRVSEDRLYEAGQVPLWLCEHVIEHYASHTPPVEQWAAKIKSEMENDK
jgi:hypothetical protein